MEGDRRKGSICTLSLVQSPEAEDHDAPKKVQTQGADEEINAETSRDLMETGLHHKVKTRF